ncbi:MAG TPA: hypothetical protein VE992_06835 [Solirubrobacteraceae bacterium]|nr:hypothetical protein [Solirubrobacteraceae bacterium]
MAGVVHIPWYATLFRGDSLTAEVSQAAAVSLRYGATQYSVQRSMDDKYRILQMVWFESKTDWYRYWDGPEMLEFRRRNSGRFQIPVVYIWHEEVAAGALGPQVGQPEPEPAPEPTPTAAV